MPRVHVVEKSRKEFPGIPKGSKYYWWKFRNSPHNKGAGGRIVRSLTPPKRQQLTQSDFLRSLYDLEDLQQDIVNEGVSGIERIEEFCTAVEELLEQTQESLDAIPEHLQESSILYERVEELESWLSECQNFEGITEEDLQNDDRSVDDFLEEFGDTGHGL